MAAFLGSLDFMGLSQRPMGGVLVSPQNDTLGFCFRLSSLTLVVSEFG